MSYRGLFGGAALVLMASVPAFTALQSPTEPPAVPALAPLTAGERTMRARLRLDVEKLAAHIGERNYAHPAQLAAGADYIETQLATAGYPVRRQRFSHDGLEFVNLEAELAGRGATGETIIIGAHYDTVLGSAGAHDNATGVAALLALARSFAGALAERSIRFVAFANEEAPFFQTDAMGSRIYARAARERGDRITLMISLDSLGYFSDAPESQSYPGALRASYPSTGNFIALVSDANSRAALEQVVTAFRAATPFPVQFGTFDAALPGVGWSDHASFWREGWPGLLVTDTAPFRNPHYHTADNQPHTVDYDRLAQIVTGLHGALTTLAGAAPPHSVAGR